MGMINNWARASRAMAGSPVAFRQFKLLLGKPGQHESELGKCYKQERQEKSRKCENR